MYSILHIKQHKHLRTCHHDDHIYKKNENFVILHDLTCLILKNSFKARLLTCITNLWSFKHLYKKRHCMFWHIIQLRKLNTTSQLKKYFFEINMFFFLYYNTKLIFFIKILDHQNVTPQKYI